MLQGISLVKRYKRLLSSSALQTRTSCGEAPKINDVIGFGYFPGARTSYRLQFDNFIFHSLQFSGEFTHYYYRFTDHFVNVRQISLKVTQKINIKRKQ